MPRRLKLVKGAGRRAMLVYGMRIFGEQDVKAVEDATARLADGGASRITMHVIEGTHAQIRNQLMRSVDAFFELLQQE
jgi:surfactin synthase thioesterase subunit